MLRATSAAPAVELSTPMAARVAHIVADYADIAADPSALDLALTRLPRHHAKAEIAAWRAMAADGEIAALVAALIEAHYDPAYRRSASARERPILRRLDLPDLSPAALDAAAAALAETLTG